MSSQDPEDDRTVIQPGESSRSFAGTSGAAPPAPAQASVPDSSADAAIPTAVEPAPAADSDDSGNALPVGTYLGEFELLRVIGEGGFGIVYLAQDHSLERQIALKEYMPSALCARTGQSQVQVKSARHRDTFDAGLKSFVNEARLLAQFDHPSLVKVYRFWEANGTAYMVMPFYEGVTLKDRLRAMGAPPDETWLMALLAPLTEALAVIHGESCFHRDIAPDNVILLGANERPLLLDFGAARRVIGDMTQALTVILKPGYAPVEQYAESPDMRQGGWTDVYALAATVHFAITGRTPPTSVGRLMNDSYVPLEQSAAGRYSPGFLRAIDKALQVRPEARTQTIGELRADLGLLADASDSQHGPLSAHGSGFGLTQPPSRDQQQPAGTPAAPAPSSRVPLFIGLGAAVLVVGGAVAYMATRPDELPTGTTAAPAAVAADSNASASEPVQIAPAAPATATAPAHFDANEQFAKVLASQSADFAVEATAVKRQLVIGRDRLSFRVKSSRDGYVQVIVLGPDGSLTLLWPNSQSQDNRISAGQVLTLPQSSWMLETAEPVGLEQFLVMVTQHPRDFSWLSTEREYYFLKLPTGERANVLVGQWQKSTPMLLGSAGSGCEGPNCDVYGAARFTVDVVR